MPWRIITTEADVDQAVSDHRTAEVHTLDQPPEDHGNAAHTPDFAEETAFLTHASRHAAGGADELAAGLIETRTNDPASPPNGRIWLRTDL